MTIETTTGPALGEASPLAGALAFIVTFAACGGSPARPARPARAPAAPTIAAAPAPPASAAPPAAPDVVQTIDGATYCAGDVAPGRAWTIEGTWRTEHLPCLHERPLAGRVFVSHADAPTVDAILANGAEITELHLKLHRRDQLPALVALPALRRLTVDIDRGPTHGPESLGVKEAVFTVDDFRLLRQLTALRELNLMYAPVDADKLAVLGTLTGLEGLSFSGVGLTSSSLKVLQPLQKLKELHVGHLTVVDSLTDFDDEAFLHLSHLPELKLEPVRLADTLTDRGLALLSRYDHWQQLDLSSTQVTSTGLAAIGHWQLHSLDLSSTKIDGAALQHIGRMHTLQTLALARTGTSTADLAPLTKLVALEHLNLAHTLVDDGLAAPLATLDQLASLDVEGTKIGKETLAALSSLKRLRSIGLRSTPVGDEVGPHLAQLPHLEQIDLSDTRVGDEALSSLAGLRGLRNLNLRGLHVTSGIRHIPSGTRFLNLRDNPNLTAAHLRLLQLTEGTVLVDDRTDLTAAAETMNTANPKVTILPR